MHRHFPGFLEDSGKNGLFAEQGIPDPTPASKAPPVHDGAHRHPGELGAPKSKDSEARDEKRGEDERREGDQVHDGGPAEKPLVLAADEDPVEREGHRAGNLHHGKHDEAADQAGNDAAVVREHVRKNGARGDEHDPDDTAAPERELRGLDPNLR